MSWWNSRSPSRSKCFRIFDPDLRHLRQRFDHDCLVWSRSLRRGLSGMEGIRPNYRLAGQGQGGENGGC
jgi:hypothetical protein